MSSGKTPEARQGTERGIETRRLHLNLDRGLYMSLRREALEEELTITATLERILRRHYREEK